jgi:hypothetical protein
MPDERSAAHTAWPERIPIERRIALRKAIERRPQGTVVCSAEELTALLDAYEHGGFRTNG